MRRRAIGVVIVLTAATALTRTDAPGASSFTVRTAQSIRTADEQTHSTVTSESRHRDALTPTSRALLQRADALQISGDYAGALDAYMEAVRADANAADLHLIDRYAPSVAPPPPDEASRADLQAEQQRADKALARHIAALRQYLQLRPGDWEATKRLLFLVDPPEAESLLEPFLKSRPRDADLYATRGDVRAKHGRFAAAIDDFVKARELDPQNAERYYIAGVAGYKAVVKDSSLTSAGKRELIKRSLAELRRAEALKPEYFEAMVKAPIIVERVAAVYPEETGKHGVSGIVILAIVVDKSGHVARATVLKSVDYGGSEAAIAAVKQWRFKPGTLNREAVDVVYNVTVRIAPPPKE
jgi:TonB family protein